MEEFELYTFLNSIESCDSNPPEFTLLEIPEIAVDSFVHEQDRLFYESVMKALVVQFVSDNKSRHGHIPAITFRNTWRHIEKQDFSEEDFTRLKSLQMGKVPLHVRIRIQDILWILNCHYPSAVDAIEGYKQLFQQYFTIENWIDSIDLIERAINIAKGLKQNEKKNELLSIVDNWLGKIIGCNESVLFIRLLTLLIKEKHGNPDKYIQLIEEFTKQYSGSLISNVENAFKLEQQCYQWKKDNQGKKGSILRQAKYYEHMALSLGSDDLRDMLIASDLLKKAYLIYNNLHMKKQSDGIMKQLDNIQIKARQFYQSFTDKIDCESFFRDIQERLQNLTTVEKLLSLVLLTPILKKKDIEEKIKQETNIYSSLATVEIIDNEGKTKARIPSLLFCDPQEYEQILEQHIHSQISKEAEFNGFLLYCIRNIILKDQVFSRDTISILTKNNTMIPEGREDLFLFAFELFFSGKELEAMYILVPQVEHTLRTLAKELGGATTRMKDDSEEDLSLGHIFNIPELIDSYDDNLLFLFRSMMIEPAGSNIRNEVAHGLIGKDNLNIYICTYFVLFVMKWLSYTAQHFHQYLENDTRIKEALKHQDES